MLDCFFLANLISILGVNKGDLVERGEKCFLLISCFIATHLELCLFILNFFSCKRRDVFEHCFFFHKSAVHKSVVISNTSFGIRSLQTVTNGQEIFVFIS